MKVVCPHCGSDDIRCVDKVINVIPVVAWRVDAEGEPKPADYGSGQVIWDACEVAVPGKPYECGDCSKSLAASELIVNPPEEETEP